MKKIFGIWMLVPLMATAQQFQGPANAAAAISTSCPFAYSSTTDYLPEEAVFASDNQYATASHCDCCDANTRCLEASGFNFDIPPAATINGILVEVEKKASAGAIIQDNGIKLIKAGSTTGISLANPANWPFTDTYIDYGGENELWGTTWMPEDINDAGFGVALASISYTCFGTGTAAISYIDNIRITVYYTNVATNVAPAKAMAFYVANPVTEPFVTLQIPEEGGTLSITIIDGMGKPINRFNATAADGSVKLSIHLAPGIYVLHAKGRVNAYTTKLLVQ